MDQKKYKASGRYIKSPDPAKTISFEHDEPVPRKSRVFVSHTAIDKPIVDLLIGLLADGCRVPYEDIFYSSNPETGVHVGTGFVEAIQSALIDAELSICVVTHNFISSPFCLMEAGAIWLMKKARIIFVVPPATFENLPGPFKSLHTINLTSASDLDRVRDIVAQRLQLAHTDTASWNQRKKTFLDEVAMLVQKRGVDKNRGLQAIEANFPIPATKLKQFLKITENGVKFFAVIFDIDSLNSINEHHGLSVGNVVLDEAGKILNGVAARDPRVVACARCGDDTFFAIVLGAEEHATVVAKDVLSKIQHISPSRLSGSFWVTASAGVAEYAENELAMDWLERANFACIEARREGGNKVRVNITPARGTWSK